MPDNMELGARVSDGWHEFPDVLDLFFIIVARWGPQLVGYLVTASRRRVAHVPVIAAMMRACPGTPGSYVYGPICVAATERGHGLFGAMYAAPRALRPGREGILFIRLDNVASRRPCADGHARGRYVRAC